MVDFFYELHLCVDESKNQCYIGGLLMNNLLFYFNKLTYHSYANFESTSQKRT